jgi:hypothetical protein
MHDGDQLLDGSTVGEYGLGEGATVQCVVRVKPTGPVESAPPPSQPAAVSEEPAQQQPSAVLLKEEEAMWIPVSSPVDPAKLKELRLAGFPADVARLALEEADNDMRKATESLRGDEEYVYM